MSEDATPWTATDAAIHDTMRSCLVDGRSAAIATVVDVEGSAYRRPGAKMVVPEAGPHLGAITAGCLEGPVAEVAAAVRDAGEPRVETYDLTDDEGWGMGLGCNGIVTVLVEPLDTSFRSALDALADRRSVAMLTSLDDPVGDRVVVSESGDIEAVDGRDPLAADVVDELLERSSQLIAEGQAGTVTVETDAGTRRVFVDGMRPAPELVLVGSQADINPVVEIARAVGFRVTVASTRGNTSADRFPNADSVETVRAPDVDEVIQAPHHTWAVVMTHNFVDDRMAVEALLETEVPYIGLMGPRERFDEIRAAWAEENTSIEQEAFDRIATPVGLDLGGGSPMEIALSIVAEVVAVRYDRGGGRLVEQEGPIHPRVLEETE